jgi:hypothetical protein
MALDPAIASEHRRAAFVRWSMYVAIALDSLFVAFSLVRYPLLDSSEEHAAEVKLFFMFRWPLLPLIAVSWWVWLHRAYLNLKLFGYGKIDEGPNWIIGCWFVPIVNLFVPFMVVRELWLRSENGNTTDRFRDPKTPAAVGWWWGMFLVGGFLTRWLWNLASADWEETAWLAPLFTVFALSASIAAGALAASVVGKIDSFQIRVATKTAPSPPSVLVGPDPVP